MQATMHNFMHDYKLCSKSHDHSLRIIFTPQDMHVLPRIWEFHFGFRWSGLEQKDSGLRWYCTLHRCILRFLLQQKVAGVRRTVEACAALQTRVRARRCLTVQALKSLGKQLRLQHVESRECSSPCKCDLQRGAHLKEGCVHVVFHATCLPRPEKMAT